MKSMNNTPMNHSGRHLCERRDQEFLKIFGPTLDLMIEQGVPHPHYAAVEFTIFNGHPHYHVDMENAYRRVCHMLKAESQKDGEQVEDVNLSSDRLRRQMWLEITGRVQQLLGQGMSIKRATEHVLTHCRASRFFITPSTALTKICPQARRRALR